MKTFFSLLLICTAVSGFAQKREKMDFFPEMSRGIGASFQKFEGLNREIAKYPQYKDLRDHAGVLQLGWFKETKQLIHNVNVMAGSSMSGDRDKRSSTIRYIGAGADIGYDFIKSKKIALYPLAGLGVQAYQARFFKDNSGVSFNDVLTSPTFQNNIRPLDLTNFFFNYRLGVGFHVTSEKHFCSVGVQAMYTGSFKDRAWKSADRQTLANAPSDNLSQIYAGLVFICRPFFMRGKNMRM